MDPISFQLLTCMPDLKNMKATMRLEELLQFIFNTEWTVPQAQADANVPAVLSPAIAFDRQGPSLTDINLKLRQMQSSHLAKLLQICPSVSV